MPICPHLCVYMFRPRILMLNTSAIDNTTNHEHSVYTRCLLRIVHTVIKMFRFLVIYEYVLVSVNRMSGME